MKKIKFTLVFIMITTLINVYGQDIQIFGGLNISNVKEASSRKTYSNDYDNLLGPNGGIKIAFSTRNNKFFETGIFISNKGFKESMSQTIQNVKVDAEGQLSLTYLEIPINVKAVVSLNNWGKIYCNLGAFIGIGVSGVIKAKATAMGETKTESTYLSLGSDPEEDDLKPLDLGINGGVGMEINRIIIGLNYSHGLLNISHVSNNNYSFNTRTLSIMLGYKIKQDNSWSIHKPKFYM